MTEKRGKRCTEEQVTEIKRRLKSNKEKVKIDKYG